jgi:RNA polymerase sigma-70 factor (ECF subfamily)
MGTAIQRARGDLPDEFRLAVVLCDVEEFSYREIADIMDCPVGTVMSRLHRGRKLLQTALREHAVRAGIIKELPSETGGQVIPITAAVRKAAGGGNKA